MSGRAMPMRRTAGLAFLITGRTDNSTGSSKREYRPNSVADRSYYTDQQQRNEKYFGTPLMRKILKSGPIAPPVSSRKPQGQPKSLQQSQSLGSKSSERERAPKMNLPTVLSRVPGPAVPCLTRVRFLGRAPLSPRGSGASRTAPAWEV